MPAAQVQTPHRGGGAAVEGYWQDREDERIIVSFEPDRRIEFTGGRISQTARILESGKGRLRLCVSGRDVMSRFQLKAGLLHLQDSDSQSERVLQRLSGPPVGLQVRPMVLPPPRPLPPEVVEEVQREVTRRFREDLRAERGAFGAEIGSAQLPMVDPLVRFRMLDVASQNRRYLEALLKEVGWVDAGRFGYTTSHAVILMVQHSADRLLMEAALPWIRRDVDAGLMAGGTFALVYDRLHLLLGEKQKYATQVGRDEDDVPIVYPTEEPERVNELRSELDLAPLSDYIKLFGGQEVRFSSACSTTSPASQN